MLKNMVIVGEVDAGKSALLAALLDSEQHDKKVEIGKTQTPIYYQNQVVDTPGEFIDNRAWYGALLSTISSSSIIIYLQPADQPIFAAPAGLLQVYSNKKIVGVISKIDVIGADVAKARRLFSMNRISEPYFEVSINDHLSINVLRDYLLTLL